MLGLGVDRFHPHHRSAARTRSCRSSSSAACENGYIYKGSYTGQYCVFDELYVNEAKPGDPCPDCGRPTETVTEENYFFKLSAFQDKLLELYEEQPEFIQPETRRNEVHRVRQAGPERSLHHAAPPSSGASRCRCEGQHVFYVWFDALTTLHERGRRRRTCGPPTCT